MTCVRLASPTGAAACAPPRPALGDAHFGVRSSDLSHGRRPRCVELGAEFRPRLCHARVTFSTAVPSRGARIRAALPRVGGCRWVLCPLEEGAAGCLEGPGSPFVPRQQPSAETKQGAEAGYRGLSIHLPARRRRLRRPRGACARGGVEAPHGGRRRLFSRLRAIASEAGRSLKTHICAGRSGVFPEGLAQFRRSIAERSGPLPSQIITPGRSGGVALWPGFWGTGLGCRPHWLCVAMLWPLPLLHRGHWTLGGCRLDGGASWSPPWGLISASLHGGAGPGPCGGSAWGPWGLSDRCEACFSPRGVNRWCRPATLPARAHAPGQPRGAGAGPCCLSPPRAPWGAGSSARALPSLCSRAFHERASRHPSVPSPAGPDVEQGPPEPACPPASGSALVGLPGRAPLRDLDFLSLVS